MVRKGKHAVTMVGVCLTAWCNAGAQVPSEASMEIRIHAPTILAALLQFSQQTGLQLVLPTDNVSVQRKAPIVEGTYTPRDALDALLRNSGFIYTFVNPRTVSVSPAPPTSESADALEASANR